MKTSRLCLLLSLGLTFIQPALAQTFAAAGHLRLIDPLDRPEDGYCFDLPATAHNCKPGLYADEAVIIDPDGAIRFPAYGNKCLTAAGLNGRALPGAALMVRDCGERTPFLEAQALQIFHLQDDGRVELNDSGLCLSAGPQSASTFDASHRWRTLYLDHCASAEPARSRWQFTVPVQATR